MSKNHDRSLAYEPNAEIKFVNEAPETVVKEIANVTADDAVFDSGSELSSLHFQVETEKLHTLGKKVCNCPFQT